MSLLDELLIKLTGDNSGLRAVIQSSGQLVEKFGASVGSSMSGAVASGVIKATIVLKALEAVLKGVYNMSIGMVQKSMENIDAQAKLADRLGMTTEALSALNYQAELAGVESGDLTAAIQKMHLSMSEATESGTGAGRALRVLGLSVSDLKGMQPEAQFGLIADRLNGMDDAAERTAVSMELFGKGGGKVFSLIAEGSEGIAAAREEADKLGLTFSRVDAAKIEAANDAMTRANKVLEGVANRVAIASAPFIEAIVQKFNEASLASDGFKSYIEYAMQAAADSVGWLADAWQVLMIAWDGAKYAIGILSGTIWRVISDVYDAIAYGIAIFQNWYEVANAVGDNISASFKLLWGALKAGFGSFSKFINDQFAKLVDGLASAMSYISDDMSAELTKMADGMRENGSAFRDEMHADMEAAVAEAADAGARMNKLLGDIDPPPNPFLEEMVENADAFAAEAQLSMEARMNEPWSSEGVHRWFDEVAALADVKAKEIADNVNSKLNANGDDAGALAREKQREENLQKLEDLRQHLATETEIEMEEYRRRQLLLHQLEESGDISKEERRALEEDLNQEHELKMLEAREKAIKSGEKFSKQSWQVQTGAIVNFLNQQLQSVDATSKTMFQIQKAGAIAAAVMNTAEGATKAFAQFGAFGFAAAAAVVAAGAMQIASIASTSFGGNSGNAARASIGPAPSVSTEGNASFGQSGGGGAPVTKYINVNWGDDTGQLISRTQAREIVKQIAEAAGDGVKVSFG